MSIYLQSVLISKKPLKKNIFFVGILEATDERMIGIRNPLYISKDPEPSLSQNGTDPEHCTGFIIKERPLHS